MTTRPVIGLRPGIRRIFLLFLLFGVDPASGEDLAEVDDCDSDKKEKDGEFIAQPCAFFHRTLLRRKGMNMLRCKPALGGERFQTRVLPPGAHDKHGGKEQTRRHEVAATTAVF